jgi:outer membrane receptor for ferrienterochelin and colicins
MGTVRIVPAGGIRSAATTVLLALATAARLAAQESDLAGRSLEDLLKMQIPSVEAASMRSQKTIDAPSSVTIVTADEIRHYGYRTFADVLRSVRGFYVSYDRNYSYVGVRGFGRPGDYNGRVLLLVDGHRINDDVYDGALVGTEFPLDVDLIDHVEVVRGPGSSLYGTSAFFAVINVVTKTGEGVKGLEVAGDAGSFETYRGRLTYGRRAGSGLDALVSGTLYDSQGPDRLYYPEYDDPSTHDGVAAGVDDDRFGSAFGRLSYRNVTLAASYVSREKTVPTGSFETVFGDPRNQTTDTRGYVDLSYARTLAGGTDFSARLYYDHYEYDGTYIYDYSETDEPFLVENRDLGKGRWWGAEARAGHTFFGKHTLTLGGEYRDYLQQYQANYDADPFVEYLDGDRSGDVAALYLQDEFAISPRVLLSAGARYDHYSTFGGTTNPRFAFIVRPSAKSAVKLLYGQAFRAPSAYELYYEAPTSKANLDLGPERIKTAEAVWEQYVGDRLRATASVFYSRIDDLISQTLDPADGMILYENLGRAETRGIEAEVAIRLPSGFEARAAYTYADATDRETGEWLTNSPHHVFQANALVPIVSGKLLAGLELQSLSERLNVRREPVPGHTVVNLNLLARRLLSSLELSAGVYDLFDARYADPGAEEHRQTAIEQDRRTFRVKAAWRF